MCGCDTAVEDVYGFTYLDIPGTRIQITVVYLSLHMLYSRPILYGSWYPTPGPRDRTQDTVTVTVHRGPDAGRAGESDDTF